MELAIPKVSGVFQANVWIFIEDIDPSNLNYLITFLDREKTIYNAVGASSSTTNLQIETDMCQSEAEYTYDTTRLKQWMLL